MIKINLFVLHLLFVFYSGLYTSKGLKSSVQEQDHQQQNAPTLLSDMLAMSMPSGAGVVAPPVNSASGGPPAVFQSSSLPHGNPLFSFQQRKFNFFEKIWYCLLDYGFKIKRS